MTTPYATDDGGDDGGDATSAGFTVSGSGSTVLAFSFTGSVVPALCTGTNLLSWWCDGDDGGDSPTESCLSAFIFSDAAGGALDFCQF